MTIDHAIEDAAHALFVDSAIGVERGRGDGKDAGKRGFHDVSLRIRRKREVWRNVSLGLSVVDG